MLACLLNLPGASFAQAPRPCPERIPANPPVIQLNQVVQGEIGASRQANAYLLRLDAGVGAIVDMESADLDSILVVCRQEGPNLFFEGRNDDRGIEVNARLTLGSQRPGDFVIFAKSFPGETGGYDLIVRKSERAQTQESNQAQRQTQRIGVDQNGRYEQNGTMNRQDRSTEARFELDVKAGQLIAIELRSVRDGIRDPALEVLDAESRDAIARDDDGGDNLDSLILLEVPRDRRLEIVARDLAGRGGAFLLTVEALNRQPLQAIALEAGKPINREFKLSRTTARIIGRSYLDGRDTSAALVLPINLSGRKDENVGICLATAGRPVAFEEIPSPLGKFERSMLETSMSPEDGPLLDILEAGPRRGFGRAESAKREPKCIPGKFISDGSASLLVGASGLGDQTLKITTEVGR